MFAPYCFNNKFMSCQVWLCTTFKCKCSLTVVHLTINIFFSNYNAFTCYFHCSIISYHFIHSLLMTHFTNYDYSFKIAWVSCIFACSYSLSVKITPIFYDFNYTCRRVKWGEHRWDLRNTGYPSLTTPTPFKTKKIHLNDKALGWNVLQPKGD